MSNKTILIVDDDVDLRDVLGDVLSLEGYEVLYAGNGKQALELLALIEKPALIILDVLMPVMNGPQFLEIFRKNAEWVSIPVMVISGFADASKIKGANAFIDKPFQCDSVLELVNEYLNNNRSFYA